MAYARGGSSPMILPSRTALTGLLAVALVAQPRAGRSQESYNPYDQIYGPPVDVPLEELAQGTVPFEGRPVRTRGRRGASPGRTKCA